MAKGKKRAGQHGGAGVEKKAAAPKACGLNATPDDGLQWLLGRGISAADFQAKHWEKEVLHVEREKDGPAYFAPFKDLSEPEGLFKMLDSGVVAVQRLNVFRCVDRNNKETPDPPPETAADVRRLFKDGWSIQWLQPQQEHAALARLVSVLESQFGSLVGVNAYMTPPGKQGLAPHYDDVEVIIMHLGGEKTWSLHKTSSAVPLAADDQTLPRYPSGDLPFEALENPISRPTLAPGDLLYLPRGTIHHAPNQSSQRAAVHLTISTYQRQSVFDLLNKTFEEGMAELWEQDETFRRGLPWGSLAPSPKQYAGLCRDVASHFRMVADAIGMEANIAEEVAAGKRGPGEERIGFVSKALAEIGGDFVRGRMPPRLGQVGGAEVVCGADVRPSSHLSVPDPSAVALQPAEGSVEGSYTMVTCAPNQQTEHMMSRGAAADTAETPCKGSGCDLGAACCDGGGRAAEGHGHGHGHDHDHDEEDSDDSDDGSDDGSEGPGQLFLPPYAAAVWRVLAAASPRHALAACSGGKPPSNGPFSAILEKAGVPKKEWSEVCCVFSRLAAEGVVLVGAPSSDDAQADCQASAKKKKRRKA